MTGVQTCALPIFGVLDTGTRIAVVLEHPLPVEQGGIDLAQGRLCLGQRHQRVPEVMPRVGRQDIKDADEEQGWLAAEPIGGPATEQLAQQRAIKRSAHGEAVHPGAQRAERLDFLLGTGDDHGVETEKKPRERGDD